MKFHVYHFPDWAQVVPLTRDGKLVMTRQYRHGTKTIGVEIPGGIIDPEDATPMDAARRELEEETGYGGGEMIALGDLYPQPALLSNRAIFFVAKNVENQRQQELDEGEDIEVVLVNPSEIGPMIQEGRIHNAMTVTALMLAWWSNHLPTI